MGELEAIRPYPARTGPKGNLVYKLLTTTDHKLIGIMYVVTCFIFFLIGGLLALLMRTELATPGLQFLSNEQFNQLFTMHGTVMLLFYATRSCSASRTWCFRCRSGRPTSRSRG
ncbi:cytochrome C and Quinol oxidase polypeptide I family protein [Mycobacterium ulcerans str. Harvey]|uniref:Cytochrome C and Quinol oxidase polypeptide I family protein n=1 Tax=Mycobacterium ulcerans str. Harvey TaxID=1299332 RepID=A0ABP3AH28_MYCUL|nr:cytochrome C and Quinol oxidase polypeptide I family protein [Mycobacterium ulcerans str. Harvey]